VNALSLRPGVSQRRNRRRRTAGFVAMLTLLGLAIGACSPTGTPSVTPAGAPGSGGSSPAARTASATCPTSQPAPLPAGQKRVVTIATVKGRIEITVDGSLSPIAAGNFVALASCGFYNGIVFHRLVPDFVIQGGDPSGNGTGGPGYEIKDEPVTAQYHRGVVAMARTSAPNSQGSQFFIVLSDQAAGALVRANTYAIFGEVTSGMDTVDAIAAMPNSGPPNNDALQPVAMDSVTVSQP
jgi:peptidyl-prolyl cis-trans isomerase B (cyclophilin B)